MTVASRQTMRSEATSVPVALAIWVALGTFWFLFEIYVWGRWVTGPYFVAVNSGPDPVPEWQKTFLTIGQILSPVLFTICMWFWVIRPWRREGRLTSDVMIVLAASTLWFWDFCPSFLVDQVQYNSYMFNRGSWGLHSWPGWVSPAGNLVAEPLFFIPTGYTLLVTSQIVLVCWIMRKIKALRPETGVATIVAGLILGCFLADSLLEISFLRTGLYAYPGAIRALTLFPGKTYQFPLTEGILFGGFAVGAMAILKFFKDDKGRTFVERGAERLSVSETKKQLVRLLAIYGYLHTGFFVLYMVPGMVAAANADAYPTGYPSYLVNGMCLYGPRANQCPGPGISIPRSER